MLCRNVIPQIWRCTKLYTGESFFPLSHPLNIFQTLKQQQQQRVMLEYSLRHWTLWLFVLWILRLVSPGRDHSFSGMFRSSHTAMRCLRLGISVGHRNMWTSYEYEGSDSLAWSYHTAIPEGNEILNFQGAKPQHVLSKVCCLHGIYTVMIIETVLKPQI